MYTSVKTYGHEQGLSCCFRQWRATHSHCSLLHGYAIAVRIEFAADKLDDRNWVVDFGGMREVKDWLKDTFDHKTLVAGDDPLLPEFERMEKAGMIDVRVVPATGCEAFARLIHEYVWSWLREKGMGDRVHIRCVEVREHAGNAATFGTY